jgi:hypothetical protein
MRTMSRSWLRLSRLLFGILLVRGLILRVCSRHPHRFGTSPGCARSGLGLIEFEIGVSKMSNEEKELWAWKWMVFGSTYGVLDTKSD